MTFNDEGLARYGDPEPLNQVCIECGHEAKVQGTCKLWACIVCTRVQKVVAA